MNSPNANNQDPLALLWIDDDQDFVQAMQCRLPEFRLVHAINPQEAVAFAKSRSFAIIVSDYTFGQDECGIALLRNLRQHQNHAQFFLVTAQILSPELKQELDQEGINALEKLNELDQFIEDLSNMATQFQQGA